MIKLITVGDLHYRLDNPENRIDDIEQAFKNKILEIVKVSKDEKVDGVLFLGDLFNRPSLSTNTIAGLANLLNEFDCPLYVVPGNHDMVGKNFNSVLNKKTGLLAKLNYIELLHDKHDKIIEKEGLTIKITAQEFTANIDYENTEKFYCRKKGEEDYLIHAVHGMLVPTPLPMDGFTLIDEIYDKTEADITYTGHYHPPFNKEYGGKIFSNPGSVVRMSTDQSEDRIPGFYVDTFTKENIERKYHYFECALPAKEVIDFDAKKEEKETQYELDLFFDKIKDVGNMRTIDPYRVMREVFELEHVDVNIKEYTGNLINQTIEEMNAYKEKQKNVGGE